MSFPRTWRQVKVRCTARFCWRFPSGWTGQSPSDSTSKSVSCDSGTYLNRRVFQPRFVCSGLSRLVWLCAWLVSAAWVHLPLTGICGVCETAAQQAKGEKVVVTYLRLAYLVAISPCGCWVIRSCKWVFCVSVDRITT